MNIIEQVLAKRPDLDSHTIFRLSIRDKDMADGAYMDWIRDGHVHPLTHTYCKELLK